MPTPYPKSENTKQKPKQKQKTRPILYTKGNPLEIIDTNKKKQKRNRKETEITWMNSNS
jgi:hypothetical protein